MKNSPCCLRSSGTELDIEAKQQHWLDYVVIVPYVREPRMPSRPNEDILKQPVRLLMLV